MREEISAYLFPIPSVLSGKDRKGRRGELEGAGEGLEGKTM
jgi:hypothetical protein